MRCAVTGREYPEFTDGIWSDGEWVSWDWINRQEYDQQLQIEYPNASLELIDAFQDLVYAAQTYKEVTGRYLQIWGELGEIYAEVECGLKRHAPGTPGSDGRIGNDWVEVKTISPEKSKPEVHVKQAGNFNKILVVRISETFEFEHKMVDRKSLKKSNGSQVRIAWETGS